MSPLLFAIFFDRIVRHVNKGLRRRGVIMRDEGSRGREIKQVLQADYALHGIIENDLQLILDEFGRACDGMNR